MMINFETMIFVLQVSCASFLFIFLMINILGEERVRGLSRSELVAILIMGGPILWVLYLMVFVLVNTNKGDE